MTFLRDITRQSTFCTFKCSNLIQGRLRESTKINPTLSGSVSNINDMATSRSVCSPLTTQVPKNTTLTEHLRLSAASGNSKEVVRLLEEGVKIVPDETGCNALHLAASAGHPNTVAALILAGCDVNASDLAGCTALQRAAAHGHVTIVKQLLKLGADVNHQDNVHGNSALHEASWKGYSQTVAALCKGRAHLQLKNRGGFAALHLCCQNGHNQSCRELLFAGCNPDVQNNYGDTSLHTSARYGHAGVTRILISAQCRVSDQNKNGDTALHIAAAMGRKKLTRILLEAGCDKSLRNKQNETARDIATRKDLKDILAILNTPPVALKAQSEMRKRDAAANKSKHNMRSSTNEKHKSHEKEKNERKREKNGSGTSSKESNSQRKDKKHKNAHKVHFEKACAGASGRQWSPYGCHYYPDPEAFPAPNLDSLPDEPLQKGEQYFLDLAGNICKGPVGVGYTCYCAPFFRNVEARLERDKQELKEHIDRAHERLDRKVSSLEQRLSHTVEKERSQCEARSLRLAEWLCRELSGFEGHMGVSERPLSQENCPNRSTTDEIRRAKSLEMLPYKEPDKWEETQELRTSARAGSVDLVDGPSSQWNGGTGDSESFPELLSNPHESLLPNWRLQHARAGRRSSIDSLERVCKLGWSLERGQVGADGAKSGATLNDDDGGASSESSDGEDDAPHERLTSQGHPGCSAPLSGESLGVVQETNSQLVPDYENIVSCDRTLWKPGHEKHILSELPYRSRTTVYDSAVSSSVVAPEYRHVETDVHNDSGYSTKVYGSSKGPSPSLSGNTELEGSSQATQGKPRIICSEKQLKNVNSYPTSTINECDNIVKLRACLKPGYRVNGSIV